MFSLQALHEMLAEDWFREAYTETERTLLLARVGVMGQDRPSPGALRFSTAVLASAPEWRLGSIEARTVCRVAADIEAAAALATRATTRTDHMLASALLYELGSMPGASAVHAESDGLPASLTAFFARSAGSVWGSLASSVSTDATEQVANDVTRLAQQSFGEVLTEAGLKFQSLDEKAADRAGVAMDELQQLAGTHQFGVTTDFIAALRRCLNERFASSSLSILGSDDETIHWLRSRGAPAELWPAQRAAIAEGMLEQDVLSFGFAAPTGSGKTALARIAIADFLSRHPDQKVIYITPSRALAAQVARDLGRALETLNVTVASLGAALTRDDVLLPNASDPDVLVFTPEKADFLLRIEPGTVAETGLVLVDEAHHIEQGTRGVLLEFYLWRLRSLLPEAARIIQLSAVAPNIDELASWLSPSGAEAVAKIDWRSSRLRVGTYEASPTGGGELLFEGLEPIQVVPPDEMARAQGQWLPQLVERLGGRGIVLVICTSPGRAESLAHALAAEREDVQEPTDEVGERLDARIEREMDPEAPLRLHYRKRIAYHHAQLPPRVRAAVEEAVSARKIDIICATTTLAEGVNFPFSTVVVESLVGKEYQLSPRALWNIAGRAGRFGVDSEGHCILFRPSQWQEKLEEYSVSDYLSSNLDDIPPVRSALGIGLARLRSAVEDGRISMDALDRVELSGIATDGRATEEAREIRGLLNVMRVGYAHAAATGTVELAEDDAPEFTRGELLAARQADEATSAFARQVAIQQRRVVATAAEQSDVLIDLAARIGWSLETQAALHEWIRGRPDWQLERFGHLVRGGRLINPEEVSFLVGPLAARMQEFEGEKLGGFTGYVATGWLAGEPLTMINLRQRTPNMARLVRVIYARVQYLLPWGLFGMSELIQLEAAIRGITIGSGVSELSLLASEGVPSIPALILVNQLDIERVDAARLARRYTADRGTDVIAWMRSQPWERVAAIVRGRDRRRLDPDLRGVWQRLTHGTAEA